MCDDCTRLAELEVHVAFAELTRDVIQLEVEQGWSYPGAARPLAPHEAAARVKFAELDRITTETAGAVARIAEAVRQAVLEALSVDLGDVASTGDGTAVLARLRQLLSSTNGATLPGLQASIDQAARQALVALEAAYAQGGAQVVQEAIRQGLPAELIPSLNPPTIGVRQALTEWARRAAENPATRTLTVAYDAALRAVRPGQPVDGFTALQSAIEAADGASTAGTEDLARQAAGQAHGAGRAAAAKATPTEPKQIYASELLDSETCGPCATVDGHTYDSMASALVDYPSAGGFRGCLGGARCRGTLVFVWRTESDPTLPSAGDGRSPNEAVPNRTPQGPSDLPTAPEPPSQQPLVLDPRFDPKPPPAAPQPAPIAMTDDELDQAIADAMSREDYAAAELLAAELDARSTEPAAGSVWDQAEAREEEMWTTPHDASNPDVAADVVHDWDDAKAGDQREHDGDLWEFNQAYGWQLIGKAGMSKADLVSRVKADWDEYLWSHQSEAEAATRGQLLRKDRRQEFLDMHGTETATTQVLFSGPASHAYYFASRELRDFWEQHPRITYSEFAVERGITDARTVAAAQKAPGAREDARNRAEEDPEKRRQRQRDAAARRKRQKFTEGSMDE